MSNISRICWLPFLLHDSTILKDKLTFSIPSLLQGQRRYINFGHMKFGCPKKLSNVWLNIWQLWQQPHTLFCVKRNKALFHEILLKCVWHKHYKYNHHPKKFLKYSLCWFKYSLLDPFNYYALAYNLFCYLLHFTYLNFYHFLNNCVIQLL